MSAYIVFIRNKTHDAEALAEYRDLVRSLSPEDYEFEMVTSASSKFQVLEGDPEAEFGVILRFPSMEKAKAWYESEAYRKAIAIRQSVADSRVFLMEGNG
jgi:uncharacterized protein (DUF1330 family)